MSVTRAVNMAFLAMGLLAWVVLAEFFGWGLGLFGPTTDVGLLGADFRLSNLLGLVAGAGLAAFLWKKPDVNAMAHEIANELDKVTWPSWNETRAATLVVVVVAVVFSMLFAFYDAVWTVLTGWIYRA